MGCDLLADGGVVSPQHLLGSLVSETLGHRRRLFDISEKDGDGAVGRGLGSKVGHLDLDRRRQGQIGTVAPVGP